MTTLTLIVSILLIDFLSLISPGQDFAIITRNTLKYSRRLGYATVLGVGFVSLLHALMAAFGLSFFMAQFPDALAAIKTAGALYLIYLGTGFIKNAHNLPAEATNIKAASKNSVTAWQGFRMGAIANALNIEPMIAYISVFALMLPTTATLSLKILICLLITLNTILYYALVARLFSLKPVQRFLQTRMKTLEKVIGVILIFLGSKNLISGQSRSS